MVVPMTLGAFRMVLSLLQVSASPVFRSGGASLLRTGVGWHHCRFEAAFSRARSCLIDRTGYPLCRTLNSNSQPAASHQPDANAHTVMPVIARSMKRCPVSASFVPSIIVARPAGCDLRCAGFTDHSTGQIGRASCRERV